MTTVAKTAGTREGPSQDTLDRLCAAAGGRAVLDHEEMAPYLHELRGRYDGRAAAVLRPRTTQQVSDILKVAHETRTGIVPQSGNTGLSGGQTPSVRGDEVILVLDGLERIRSTDPVDNTMTVEAGVPLERVHDAAHEAGRLFPLSLASKGSCRIGGNLATNAGGVAVLAYGNMRELCLGLEVVLADGRVWDGLRALRKDNTGYDLKDLFIGAEGTLGVITAAVLKLHPLPSDASVAWCAVPTPAAALQLLEVARGSGGGTVTAIELVPRIGVDVTMRHAGTRDPLAEPSPWYVLLELKGQQPPGTLNGTMERLLADAFERGLVSDAAIAASETQAKEFWRLREDLPEARRHEGASVAHDVAVPVSKVPEFIAEATEAMKRLVPGCRPMPFGHVGDGNIHFNISQPRDADGKSFLARSDEINDLVYDIVLKHGGTISAEHGIGRLKRERMRAIKSPVELDLMRTLKSALDPRGILNPGKLLPDT